MNSTRKDHETPKLNRLKQIARFPLLRPKVRQGYFLILISMILILSSLVGCGPSTEDL